MDSRTTYNLLAHDSRLFTFATIFLNIFIIVYGIYTNRNIGRSRTLPDPFVNLSDVERKSLDIRSNLSETQVYCLSDPSELVSDLTATLTNVNQNAP